MEHQVSILKHNYFSSWKLERGVLNIDDIYDEDAQKIDDGFVNHEQPVLLFRFSKINCTECVVKQIDIIKELIQSNVVKYKMICDYSKDKRSLGIFKRMNKIKDTVYNCEKLIDNEPGTLYFCIYYKGFVSDVFFPNEDFPELTKNYLKEMSTKYFNVK